MPRQKKPLAVLDIETDPFLYNRTPSPFAIEFYTPKIHAQFWGDNCIYEFIEWIKNNVTEEHIIYAHNGGGFDFWYLQQWIQNPLFFISGKVAKCGFINGHELRDSYKMIPVPLAAYQKTEIDYNIFEFPEREKPHNKKKILSYLHDDCRDLYNMIIDFISRHGFHLTQAGAAMSALKKLHPQKSSSEYFDDKFRPFYFGGRNECFNSGELIGNWKIYDVNSMYPFVMANYPHPADTRYNLSKNLRDDRVSFLHCKVTSNGALPVITKKGLKFPHGTFECYVCSHELIEGINLGFVKLHHIYTSYQFQQSQFFDEFVNKYSQLKIESEIAGDKGGRLFAKLLLNSAYGKFAQNPRKYKDCALFDSITECMNAGYSPHLIYGDKLIGAKPAEIKSWSYNNVAIAASITSAARTVLMKGLANAINPIYCDTDSIICESLNMELHESKLGAWKLEGDCDTLYIAGKKLYACYKNGQPLIVGGKEKKASKGVNLSADNLKRIALGEVQLVPIEAPALRVGKDAKFIKRKIKKTA